MGNFRDKPSIIIDGRHYHFAEVILHYQDDPFPGGLNYQWTVPKTLFSPSRWVEFEFSNAVMPESNRARQWFFWLATVLAECERQEVLSSESKPMSLQFVLNSIRELHITEDTLFIIGECSPFVSGSGAKGEKRNASRSN